MVPARELEKLYRYGINGPSFSFVILNLFFFFSYFVLWLRKYVGWSFNDIVIHVTCLFILIIFLLLGRILAEFIVLLPLPPL